METWLKRFFFQRTWDKLLLAPAGPPDPPDRVTVEEVTDSTAQLSWSPGRDNGSPITSYIVQARTAFTVGWQAVDTGTSLPLPISPTCPAPESVPHFHQSQSHTQVSFPAAPAVPESVNGNTLTAAVVGLNAWVEYEFRVVARNVVGLGPPSPPSAKTRTEDASTFPLAQGRAV